MFFFGLRCGFDTASWLALWEIVGGWVWGVRVFCEVEVMGERGELLIAHLR